MGRPATYVMPEHKVCSICGIDKAASEFRFAGGGKYLNTYCKYCDHRRPANAASNKRRDQRIKTDPEFAEHQKKKQSESKRLKRYGLTAEQYHYMLGEQGGRCKSCGDILGTGREVHVDHDHLSGRVRGILCMLCNLALGYTKDDPDRLRKLADYIERS